MSISAPYDAHPTISGHHITLCAAVLATWWRATRAPSPVAPAETEEVPA